MSGSKDLALASNERFAGNDVQAALDQKVLETPRTIEACGRLGLMIEDLRIRSFESFFIPGDMKQKQQLRFDHYEKKRKERFAQVLAERAKVIAQNAKKGEVPGVQSAQFLSMLESLFEKEAKRLEVDLKSQLRSHSCLVKENEEQLKRESDLQSKLIEHDMRIQKANQESSKVGQEAKKRFEDRHSTHAECLAKIDQQMQDKQAQFGRQVLAEEHRLANFMEAQRMENSDKAHVFREKVEKMKKKTEERIEQRRIEGELKFQEIGQKIAMVDARREQEQQRRMMRSEEQHLHIMDVRENKDRINRVDGHRREELREQNGNNIERIETLLALKDQLLDQRRARNGKAEATKGSRGLNLRRDCLPGPGHYEATSHMKENPVMKMNLAKVPGMVDDAIKGTAANPAPGTYQSSILVNGDKVGQANAGGGKFGEGDRKSFLDDAQKAKAFLPEPGRYEPKPTLDARAPKLARARFEETGNDRKNPKSYPVWARPPTQTPGPAGYSVDDFTRKEVVRRAARSLPNLTRDMLRPGRTNVANAK